MTSETLLIILAPVYTNAELPYFMILSESHWIFSRNSDAMIQKFFFSLHT